MAFGKMLKKLMQKPNVKKTFKQLKEKNTKKSKDVKYKSKSKSQMKINRGGIVVTSSGLLSKKNMKIKKKKLLGE